MACENDKVMTGLFNEHDNGVESRRLRMYCTHSASAVADQETCWWYNTMLLGGHRVFFNSGMGVGAMRLCVSARIDSD